MQAIVPFANFLNLDGSINRITKARLDLAISLFMEGMKMIIPGADFQKLGITLSQAMKDYAISKGIPEKSIIIEELSLDTLCQVFRTRLICEKKGIKKLIWVTDQNHMPKVKFYVNFIFGSLEGMEVKEVNIKAEPKKDFMKDFNKTFDGNEK